MNDVRPCISGIMLLLVVVGLMSPACFGAERPNVVLIMADDMGYECVGANGGTSYRTPNLDELARTGLRFTNCHSQPLCTPSRVQLMTGLYNHRNYIRFGLLEPEAYTFGHLFREAGYATYVAGKWQLEGGMEGPGKFGFDGYTLWQLTRRPSRYPNPGLEVNGEERDYSQGEYGPDLVSDALCQFIRDHREKPFFAYYPMILPHFPFEPTPDSADWDPKAAGAKGNGREKYFADMVAYTDKIVGKVVRTLEEARVRERTLVLFTGDNGTFKGLRSRMGEQVVIGGKGTTLDTGTHVPLIASWPGTISAGISEDLVDFTDFMVTIAEVIGQPLPEKIPFDGISFLPTLLGKIGGQREWIYCWYQRDGVRDKASQHVRTADYKLYADGRLFHTRSDPQETAPMNTTTDPELMALRIKLQGVLDRMAASEWQKTR